MHFLSGRPDPGADGRAAAVSLSETEGSFLFMSIMNHARVRPTPTGRPAHLELMNDAEGRGLSAQDLNQSSRQMGCAGK